MTRKDFFDSICSKLSGVYPLQEARAIAFVLFEVYYGLNRHDIFLYPDIEIDNTAHTEDAVDQLVKFRPLQYVLGQAWFCDMRFAVNENVLIPRPETEELIRWISDKHAGTTPEILDIGTGSGCIAVSLATLLPEAAVSAVDISPEALEVARQNALANEAEVCFSLCDILNENPDGRYDIIVSNPPYVMESEKTLMRRNVLDYEPHLALFVEDDNRLIFYRRIAEYASGALKSGGVLYFEINESTGKELIQMLASKGFQEIELRKDIFDKERMVRAVWR